MPVLTTFEEVEGLCGVCPLAGPEFVDPITSSSLRQTLIESVCGLGLGPHDGCHHEVIQVPGEGGS